MSLFTDNAPRQFPPNERQLLIKKAKINKIILIENNFAKLNIFINEKKQGAKAPYLEKD